MEVQTNTVKTGDPSLVPL